MGRPKVSPRIKNIALAFVRIVTKNEPGITSEECISVNSQFGRKSLHSAMMHCLPHLTRSLDRVENREVTLISICRVTRLSLCIVDIFVLHDYFSLTLVKLDWIEQGISQMELNKLVRAQVREILIYPEPSVPSQQLDDTCYMLNCIQSHLFLPSNWTACYTINILR